jgi:hypothetical protein
MKRPSTPATSFNLCKAPWLLVAQLGRTDHHRKCPFIGVKRSRSPTPSQAEIDPERPSIGNI